MATFEFLIHGLDVGEANIATLVLRTHDQQTLRVRVSPSDAQCLASEIAGLMTSRSRMATSICRLVDRLDGALAEVELLRGGGNIVEAQLIVATSLDRVAVPVPFGDGIAIALANRLPVTGDFSLASLLRFNEDVEETLPPTMERFLNSLPDL